jgi:hypothetical protein
MSNKNLIMSYYNLKGPSLYIYNCGVTEEILMSGEDQVPRDKVNRYEGIASKTVMV